MFRVITFQIDKPKFMMLCDSRDCFTQGHMDIPIAFPIVTKEQGEELGKQQMNFFAALLKLGWIVGWDGQFCVEHAKQMMGQVATERKLVEIANSMPGGALGGLRVMPPPPNGGKK